MNFLMLAVAALLTQSTVKALPAGFADTPHLSARDTARLDDPQPVLSAEAFDALMELWQAGHHRGACLKGEVRRDARGGSVLHITHAFSADFLHLCHGHRNVGAAVFLYEGASSNDAQIGQQTAKLLIANPDWLVVGAITGLEERMTRNSGGTIEPAAALSAQFSVWTQTMTHNRT